MSSFFPWQIDDAILYIDIGYGAHAPKIVILYAFFRHFVVFLGHFCHLSVIFLSCFQGLGNV